MSSTLFYLESAVTTFGGLALAVVPAVASQYIPMLTKYSTADLRIAGAFLFFLGGLFCTMPKAGASGAKAASIGNFFIAAVAAFNLYESKAYLNFRPTCNWVTFIYAAVAGLLHNVLAPKKSTSSKKKD